MTKPINTCSLCGDKATHTFNSENHPDAYMCTECLEEIEREERLCPVCLNKECVCWERDEILGLAR